MTNIVLTIDGKSHKLVEGNVECDNCSLKDFCFDTGSSSLCVDLTDRQNYSFVEIGKMSIDKIDSISEGIDKIINILNEKL